MSIKKAVVVSISIIIVGFIIIFFYKKITERTNEEYISIFLDNREDFEYIAEMMQQWPDRTSINLENGISSENLEIAKIVENNTELYGHLKKLHDLKEFRWVVKLHNRTEFYFSKPPKDYHGGFLYGENLKADDFVRYKIDENWFLEIIPNV